MLMSLSFGTNVAPSPPVLKLKTLPFLTVSSVGKVFLRFSVERRFPTIICREVYFSKLLLRCPREIEKPKSTPISLPLFPLCPPLLANSRTIRSQRFNQEERALTCMYRRPCTATKMIPFFEAPFPTPIPRRVCTAENIAVHLHQATQMELLYLILLLNLTPNIHLARQPYDAYPDTIP